MGPGHTSRRTGPLTGPSTRAPQSAVAHLRQSTAHSGLRRSADVPSGPAWPAFFCCPHCSGLWNADRSPAPAAHPPPAPPSGRGRAPAQRGQGVKLRRRRGPTYPTRPPRPALPVSRRLLSRNRLSIALAVAGQRQPPARAVCSPSALSAAIPRGCYTPAAPFVSCARYLCHGQRGRATRHLPASSTADAPPPYQQVGPGGVRYPPPPLAQRALPRPACASST